MISNNQPEPHWEATHVWVSRKWLPQYRGSGLRIFVGHKGKFLVEFEDGTKVVTVRGTFRKIANIGKGVPWIRFFSIV